MTNNEGFQEDEWQYDNNIYGDNSSQLPEELLIVTEFVEITRIDINKLLQNAACIYTNALVNWWYDIIISKSDIQHDTVQCLNNMVKFLKNSHKRHPIYEDLAARNRYLRQGWVITSHSKLQM